MPKSVYFLHHDAHMNERQSDGVELCMIPEFCDSKIYFYCSEYSMFWGSIEHAGNYEKCLDLKLRKTIRPATLKEICDEGLCDYIDSIKEYRIENGKIAEIRYINLTSA